MHLCVPAAIDQEPQAVGKPLTDGLRVFGAFWLSTLEALLSSENS